MVFTIMAVLDAAYYEVPIYSHVSDPRLYRSANDLRGDGLGGLFRRPPTLLGSIRRFRIKKAVRGSCYAAGCTKVVLY